MFWVINLKGKVVKCEGCQEVYLPKGYSSGCRFLEAEFRHEYEHSELRDYSEYYANYRSIVISYVVDGETRCIEFKNISLAHRYNVGEMILLVYNKRKRTIHIKDY